MTEKQTCKQLPADEKDLDEEQTGGNTTDDRDDEHLSDVTDGIGCVEVWEHLSEQRSEDD